MHIPVFDNELNAVINSSNTNNGSQPIGPIKSGDYYSVTIFGSVTYTLTVTGINGETLIRTVEITVEILNY